MVDIMQYCICSYTLLWRLLTPLFNFSKLKHKTFFAKTHTASLRLIAFCFQSNQII